MIGYGLEMVEADERELTEEEWWAAWGPELERRIKDLDEGREITLTHEEVRARLRARFPFLRATEAVILEDTGAC